MNILTEKRRDAPRLAHHLGIALRFVDIFTRKPLSVPLVVAIPAENWQAVHRHPDSTYRFVFTNRQVPEGDFEVSVSAPNAEYSNFESIHILLPVTPSASPILRSDYLAEFPMWPTRHHRTPAGETAVIGRITSSDGITFVDGLKIVLFEKPDVMTTPPADPTEYTYTDGHGEFLFRLPNQKFLFRSPDGNGDTSEGGVDLTVNFGIEVINPEGPVEVDPSSFSIKVGKPQFLVFAVP